MRLLLGFWGYGGSVRTVLGGGMMSWGSLDHIGSTVGIKRVKRGRLV